MPAVILVLGNSHTQALSEGLSSGYQQAADVEINVKWTYAPAEGKPQGDLTVQEALQVVASLSATDIVAVSYAGTFHNILGLLKHELPFDIAPKENYRDDTTLIPLNAMRAQLHDLNKNRTLIPNIKAATKASVYHIAPPPPKADEEFIKSRMKRYRGQFLDQFGLNPPSLRQKLWALEMNVLEGVCKDWGIGFVHAPSDALDEYGFLCRDFYGSDATHANSAYGKLVLRQLEQLSPHSVKNGEK